MESCSVYFFCVWLLSVKIMFVRFSHMLCDLEVYSFLSLHTISLYEHTTRVYPFCCRWTFGLFQFWAIANNGSVNILFFFLNIFIGI